MRKNILLRVLFTIVVIQLLRLLKIQPYSFIACQFNDRKTQIDACYSSENLWFPKDLWLFLKDH